MKVFHAGRKVQAGCVIGAEAVWIVVLLHKLAEKLSPQLSPHLRLGVEY